MTKRIEGGKAVSTESPSACPELSSAALPFCSKILLIDSCRVSREFLAHTVEKRDKLLKVFCAPEVMQTTSRDFDLIILNMHVDSIDDLELTTQMLLLKATFQDVPFVVIVDAENDRLTASLLWRFDMCGYIMNSLNPATLAATIRLICAGGPYQPMLPPVLSRDRALAKVEATASPPLRSSSAAGLAHGFTSRENDVLRLLRQGKPNKVIAYELSISVNTAKVHVRNIMRKLHATNRTQVVVGLPPRSWSSLQ